MNTSTLFWYILLSASLVCCNFSHDDEVIIPLDPAASMIIDFNARRCGTESCWKIPLTWSDSSCSDTFYIKDKQDSIRVWFSYVKSGCRLEYLDVNYYCDSDSMLVFFESMKRSLRKHGWNIDNRALTKDSLDSSAKFVGTNRRGRLNVGIVDDPTLRIHADENSQPYIYYRYYVR